MSCLIKCVCDAFSERLDVAGQHLEWYDVDAENGRGADRWTADKTRAIRFKDAGDALATWKRQSTVVPLRTDGKPNRPLTAYTIEIVRMHDA